MAEVAGLVIGGISFSALFDSVVTCFERIHVAREFGNSYTRYQTNLEVLELRLSRWRDAVNRLSATNAIVFTQQETDLIEEILSDINDLFVKAEKKSKRFKQGPVPTNGTDTASTASGQSDETNRLTKAVKKLCLKRSGLSKYRANQTKWAVYIENEFKRLLEDLTRQVDDLEKIVPPNVITLEQTLAAMRIEDAEVLVKQENLEPSEITLIEESAEQVDPAFVEPMKEAVPAMAGSRHEYTRNRTEHAARAIFGDHIAAGYDGPISDAKNVYRDNYAGGQSTVIFGNSYGGKGFWDD